MQLVVRRGKTGELEMRQVLILQAQCVIMSFKARLVLKPKVILNIFKVLLLITVSVCVHFILPFFSFILPFLNLHDIDLLPSICKAYSPVYQGRQKGEKKIIQFIVFYYFHLALLIFIVCCFSLFPLSCINIVWKIYETMFIGYAKNLWFSSQALNKTNSY